MTANEPAGLDERLEIETPERVKIVYELAGIGSRFAAGLVDGFLLAVLGVVVGLGFVVAASVALPKKDEEKLAFTMATIGVGFALLLGYYLAFEWMWSGQTPGKRLLRIRVRSDTGGPASSAAIIVRNVLRIADALPMAPPYGLGGVVMFANRRAKRIGDYAAGTVVVRERQDALVVPSLAGSWSESGDALDPAEIARLRSFLARAPQLIRERRVEIARRLAEEAALRHGLPLGDPESLLRALAAGRTPRQIREAHGPRPGSSA